MPVSILGIPFDANSSYLKGAAEAPPLIREALFSESSNLFTEMGVDLGASGNLFDAGDLQLGRTPREDFQEIENSAGALLQQQTPVIFLGGDHSISFPLVRACHRTYPELSIVHFDAHPDLYPEYDGNRYSHACPFARILENQLARTLVQIGIRSSNAIQQEQIQRYRVKVFPMKYGVPGIAARAGFKLEGPVYVSFDMDALDPAFAPGVSHWEPGGMSVRDALACLQSLEINIVAADIVEFNPVRDNSGRTAMVCAKLLKEIAGKMLSAGSP